MEENTESPWKTEPGLLISTERHRERRLKQRHLLSTKVTNADRRNTASPNVENAKCNLLRALYMYKAADEKSKLAIITLRASRLSVNYVLNGEML